MKTLSTVTVIILILAALIFMEQVTVRGFCSELFNELTTLEELLKNDNDVRYVTKKITDYWEEKKNTVYIFANHGNFSEIEAYIYSLEYSIGKNSAESSLFYINTLKHRIEELKDACLFKRGNIL